jgi:uncharacterized protein YndB with AHSA1/START domain
MSVSTRRTTDWWSVPRQRPKRQYSRAGFRLVAAVDSVKRAPEADAALAGIEEGWNQSLDRLAEYLPKA